jgi:uncharacterized membrane protein (UPF0127 family)
MLRAVIGVCFFLMAQAPPDWAVAVFPSGAEFSLEIAATPQQRQLGYMHREKIPANEGMLFLFDEPQRHGIWMRNCRAALDIIWLDKSLRVVEIFADAQPCPAEGPCPSMQPMQVADYVLEVAAGRAAAEKLRPGDLLVIHAEPPLQ